MFARNRRTNIAVDRCMWVTPPEPLPELVPERSGRGVVGEPGVLVRCGDGVEDGPCLASACFVGLDHLWEQQVPAGAAQGKQCGVADLGVRGQPVQRAGKMQRIVQFGGVHPQSEPQREAQFLGVRLG